jgi:hypothetical protein
MIFTEVDPAAVAFYRLRLVGPSLFRGTELGRKADALGTMAASSVPLFYAIRDYRAPAWLMSFSGSCNIIVA